MNVCVGQQDMSILGIFQELLELLSVGIATETAIVISVALLQWFDEEGSRKYQ